MISQPHAVASPKISYVTAFCIRYGHGLGLVQVKAVLNNQ